MNETLELAWAAVARDPDLTKSLPRIAAAFERACGLSGLRVDRLDTGQRQWIVLASTGGASGEPLPATAEDATRLRRSSSDTAALATTPSGLARIPGDAEAEAFAAPLDSCDETVVRAIWLIEPGRAEAFRPIGERLLELLGVALVNHQRWQEWRALRDSARAERLTALQQRPSTDLPTEPIGERGGLQAVFERVDMAAPSDMSILLLGATGSGKEVIARAVHERSPRGGAPFIRVNCGAIPPELIDSELFGHEKGSFTGAVAARRGWFERADGGTLFLDEVAELSAVAQVRLLRVLQEKRLTRVGGEREIAVDVRVIAATHRDLERRVADERFREDLWYRLAAFPIRIPSLAERPEDMPALARYFTERAAARLGLPAASPTDTQIETLRRYAWPGNVRELISVIERAVVLGQGRHLELDAALGVAVSPPSPARDDSRPFDGDMPERLDDVIAAHILRILGQTGGRMAGPHGAARRLGVHPNTLRSRMRRLGIANTRITDDDASHDNS